MSDAYGDGHRLAAGTRLGRCRLTHCIGEGGMGTVYEGVHEGLGKRVAIKTLHAGSARSPELIARFVREGKAAAKIRHANVVDVFDVAVHEGTPYLVMEYLEGEDLGARMEHVAPMSPSAIADRMPASANDAGTSAGERDAIAKPASPGADQTAAKAARGRVERGGRRPSRRERSVPAAQAIAAPAAPAAAPPAVRPEPPSPTQHAPADGDDPFRDRK
jgi:Protein kinase domain